MKNVYFAIPEIYGDSLSYYEVLRELINAMNVIIDNYDTIPEQIADAVKNLDAAQLFSAVLNQLIDTIATDNTKSANAVKVYKKHDLLYATFNETVNLYESLIDFTTGTETELIVGTNIREVNISELFIELRKMIEDETKSREQANTALQNAINNETSARSQADTTLQNAINTETSARSQADTTLKQNINAETSARSQADTTLQQNINAEKSAREQADTALQTKIDNEVQARTQADTALQQNINAETSAREQADTDLQTKIESKANKNDVLTMEQIQSSIDLNGKIAGASALKDVIRRYSLYIEAKSNGTLNISDLITDREYLLLYTSKTGAIASGAVLLSNGTVSDYLAPLSNNPESQLVFTLNYPNIKIQNNAQRPFNAYITIIG